MIFRAAEMRLLIFRGVYFSMKTAVIKAIVHVLTDEKTRNRIIVLILSIVVGLLGMMVMPFVVLSVMGQMEAQGKPEEISGQRILLPV